MATYSNSAREVEMPNGDVVVLHNGVTANTTSNIKKFKYDDNGHVTESTDANATDLNLNSYSTPTTGSTAIGTSDAVQTAIGKLDHQSQIDQSNIWYAINNGATNQFFILNGYYQLSSVASVTADNGALTFSNSVTYTSNAEIGKITLKAGTYVLTNRYVKVGGSIYGDIRLMDGETNLTSGEVAEFTIGTDKTLSLMAYVYTGSLSNPVTIKPLLYEKELWDQKTDYMPPALPNYDLTRLEAEDRAGLIDVVDGGAKNVFPPNDFQGTGITATNNHNGTYTVTGSAGSTAVTIVAEFTVSAGTYILSGCPSGGNRDNGYSMDLRTTSGTAIESSIDVGSGSQPTTLTAGTYRMTIRFAANYSAPSGGLTFKPMLATKAAFGVSNKFVPYRPNYDLVSYLANAGGFHDATHGSFVQNADLNAISESCVRLYHSPSNNPTTATYVLVKTYMLDSTTGMQEATAFASPVKSYTRVKMASTWGSWVETTNVSS